MDIIDEINSSEKLLSLKAAAMRIPIAGTFELLPACNMDCKMCYIRTSFSEMKQQGNMLSVSQWLKIAEEAVHEGMLFLLITGGEPLLYPDFCELYLKICELGIVPVLNTNGTLMNARFADTLALNRPRRVNISLYGASNDTYARLCNNPNGFTQVMNAIHLLKERSIAVKLNCSLTPYNINDFEQMHKIADTLQLPLQITPYMFPPVRKSPETRCDFLRFDPETAAELLLKHERLITKNDEQWLQILKSRLTTYHNALNDPPSFSSCGFSCYATKNNFWIDWKGNMLACAMLNFSEISVLEYGFKKSWDKLVNKGSKIPNSLKCCSCAKRSLCQRCSASSYAETNALDGTPTYLCKMTDALIKKMEDYVL